MIRFDGREEARARLLHPKPADLAEQFPPSLWLPPYVSQRAANTLAASITQGESYSLNFRHLGEGRWVASDEIAGRGLTSEGRVPAQPLSAVSAFRPPHLRLVTHPIEDEKTVAAKFLSRRSAQTPDLPVQRATLIKQDVALDKFRSTLPSGEEAAAIVSARISRASVAFLFLSVAGATLAVAQNVDQARGVVGSFLPLYIATDERRDLADTAYNGIARAEQEVGESWLSLPELERHIVHATAEALPGFVLYHGAGPNAEFTRATDQLAA